MNKFLVGLVLGIAIAGGLAFYLNNMPNQIVNKVSNGSSDAKSSGSGPIILAPGTKLHEVNSSDANAASAPDYDFYDILQGKKASSGSTQDQQKLSTKYFVQAGAFSDSDLANEMKARIALLGIDASIRSEQNNGKVINHIIIGPYDNESQAQSITSQLSSNNISATIIKVGSNNN